MNDNLLQLVGTDGQLGFQRFLIQTRINLIKLLLLSIARPLSLMDTKREKYIRDAFEYEII